MASGKNSFTLVATDLAGNEALVEGAFTRESSTVTLIEGSNLVVEHRKPLVIPQRAKTLELSYSDLRFDTSDDFVNDSFEAALVDVDGRSLVHTIDPGTPDREAFLNITEEEPVAFGQGVAFTPGTVRLDISPLFPGIEAQLIFRLINNDTDTTTTVSIDDIAYTPEPIEPVPPPAADIKQPASSVDDDQGTAALFSDGSPPLKALIGASIPAKTPRGQALRITTPDGFSIRTYASLNQPRSLAVPPRGSVFDNELYVSQYESGPVIRLSGKRTITFDKLDTADGPVLVVDQFFSDGARFDGLPVRDASSTLRPENQFSSPNVGEVGPDRTTVTFVDPVSGLPGTTTSVKATFFDEHIGTTLVEMTAYDLNGNVIKTIDAVTSATGFETLSIKAHGIHRVTLQGDSDGADFDDFKFTAVEAVDRILAINDSGEVRVGADLIAESDPGTISFPPAGSPFGDFLYISGNNRDGGRVGDRGGTILRLARDGTVVDFSPIGLPDGPGEPAGIAFGTGNLLGHDIYVSNSSDLPGDILRLNSSGEVTVHVTDGEFGNVFGSSGMHSNRVAIPTDLVSWGGDWGLQRPGLSSAPRLQSPGEPHRRLP